jgi:hypothetical protein
MLQMQLPVLEGFSEGPDHERPDGQQVWAPLRGARRVAPREGRGEKGEGRLVARATTSRSY